MDEKPTPPKPGAKTTEFWLTLAASFVGALLASGVLPSDHWAMKAAGVAMMTLSTLGYNVSRGRAKASK